jgi:hypothetical protein
VAGCHAAPEGRIRSAAITERKLMPEKLASPSMRVQTARLRLGSRDCGAVKLLSTQIVRKQAKAIFFISDNATRCMQRRRQRFPTVRMVGWVGNGEARAKMEDINACASTET